MARKVGIWDRVVGFVTGKGGQRVARERKAKELSKEIQGPVQRPTPPTPPAASKPVQTPKPAQLPSAEMYDAVPESSQKQFKIATATMAELELLIMSEEPIEVRRAAQQQWLAIAPRPLHPQLPFGAVEGLGEGDFWWAFRENYTESEVF